MKKLLGLLGTILVTGNVIPNIIAASSYKKIENINNSKKLIRIKRQNDKFKKSTNTYNEIGKHSDDIYFIKLTPIFWKELINLHTVYYKDSFSSIFEKRIWMEFPNVEDGYKIDFNHLGRYVYTYIEENKNQWNKFDETERIKIYFNVRAERIDTRKEKGMGFWQRLFEDIAMNDEPLSQLHDYYYDNNTRTEWYIFNFSLNTDDNKSDKKIFKSNNYNDNIKINNLENDFQDFNNTSIDLGIIDDENDKTILDALQKQYSNLKISELKVFNKNEYSNIAKNAFAKIKINSTSTNYPRIILKPTLSFLSKIKLKELSDNIKNDSLFKKWEENFNSWEKEVNRQLKEDVSKYGNDEKGQALKRTWKGNKINEINDKLFSFSHMLETIESKFKINELADNITQGIKNLREEIDNLTKNIKKIEKEIDQIKNPNFHKKMDNLLLTFMNRNYSKINIPMFYLSFPVIYFWMNNLVSIINIFSLLYDEYNSSNSNTFTQSHDITLNMEQIKNKKWQEQISTYFESANLKESNFDYPFQTKFKDIIQILLNNITSYNVSADGSCLFWAVATSYLLPARNNNEEFKARFIQLFGELKLNHLTHIQNLLQQFDLKNNSTNQLWYEDQTAQNLVRNIFRNRVVDYITDNLDNHTQSNVNNNQAESFRRAIELSENQIYVNSYLERMRGINEWGGQIEILAMGNMLNSNINVNNRNIYLTTNNSTENIQLLHVNENHYNFNLPNQNVPEPNTNTNQNIRGGGDQSQLDNIYNYNLSLNSFQLKNNEYHFLDQETEQNSLKNSENLKIYLISNKNKIINKYNALLKDEKQQKLNEINEHYQTLSQNEQKNFKEKLAKIGGTAAIGAGISAIGTKITVSGSVASSVGTTSEAIEMTPLLSEESLAAAETLSVVGETAVIATEGAVISTEAATASALAPETLGLSLVIGGLLIAGTAIIWWLSDHDNTQQAVKHQSHNQYNEIEKYYKFLAHDQLKLDIDINEWNKIKQIYQENSNSYQEFKNKIKSEITNFHKEDHSGWGGLISDNDINILIKIIFDHFQEINNHFFSNSNHKWKIITNTIGSYFIIEK